MRRRHGNTVKILMILSARHATLNITRRAMSSEAVRVAAGTRHDMLLTQRSMRQAAREAGSGMSARRMTQRKRYTRGRKRQHKAAMVAGAFCRQPPLSGKQGRQRQRARAICSICAVSRAMRHVAVRAASREHTCYARARYALQDPPSSSARHHYPAAALTCYAAVRRARRQRERAGARAASRAPPRHTKRHVSAPLQRARADPDAPRTASHMPYGRQRCCRHGAAICRALLMFMRYRYDTLRAATSRGRYARHYALRRTICCCWHMRERRSGIYWR